MTQSASGRERVSWERARVSTATRERKPRDKRLVFMGLGWLRLLPADDAINQIGVMSVFECFCIIACKAVV